MGITGWIHPIRDLSLERATLTAMARTGDVDSTGSVVVRLAKSAAIACQGTAVGYADGGHPDRRDPELMVAVDGRLHHRDQLQSQLGRWPRPDVSDADLLLHAYRRWSTRLVEHIDGTYAIAVWDSLERQLLLICDRTGAKTWYYRSDTDGGLLFATSIRGLLAHPGTTNLIDADGLNELLTIGPIRTPGHGVLRGVHELAAGYLGRVVPGRICTYQYARWPADQHHHDLDTTTTFIRHTLADTTLPQREQQPGAVLLSGGIASAAAAAFTAAPTAARPVAYTLALAGPWSQPPHAGVDVTAAARTAAHLHLRHTMVTPDTDAVLAAGAAARSVLDFPGEGATDAAIFTLLRRVAATTTSVVTGDGAAITFGDQWWQHQPDSGDTFAWHRRDLAPVDLLCADARLHLLPEAYVKYRYAEATRTIPDVITDDRTGRAHRRAAHLTLTHCLPARLRRLDQLATAAGLTVHTPFTAWPLARYLAGVPYPVRHLTTVRLGLLRHTVADLLPASVTWLPSLPPPSAHVLPAWRRSQHEQLHALLTDLSQPLQPLLDRARLTDLLDQPANQRPRSWHTSITYLLDVNTWLSQHHVTLT